MVQWLGLCASTAGGPGLISGWGTKILQAVRCGQKKKKKMEQGDHQIPFMSLSSCLRDSLVAIKIKTIFKATSLGEADLPRLGILVTSNRS